MVIRVDDLNGVPRRTVQRLHRGKVVPESRVDLHGLTAAEAEEEINDFLAESLDQEHRLVLIITGKGDGILRSALPNFLAPWEGDIIAVQTAHSSHGGGGAFYVLLRRGRA